MNYLVNSIVNVSIILAVLAFIAGILYLPGGSSNDKAFGVFVALSLPSAGAFVNYYFLQETR